MRVVWVCCAAQEDEEPKTRVVDWRRHPGPSARSALAGVFAWPLCACHPCAVQCFGEARVLGAAQPATYRLYNCRRCGVQVRICRRCDHGNIYCAGACAEIRRRESLRRAAARYQRTRRGAHRHALRQRRWRTRQPHTVTHQGCLRGARACKVSVPAVTEGESSDASGEASGLEPTGAGVSPGAAPARCSFCSGVLPPWTRFHLWQWSG